MGVKRDGVGGPRRWARWSGLAALTATLAACGGAMQRPAPADEAAAPPQMPFEGITVVAADPVPAAFVTHYGVNPTIDTAEDAVSRFAADVDTAAYDHARAALSDGRLPDPGAVRVEAFLNAFDYGDAPPAAGAELALHAEVFPSPHRRGYHVMRVALRARPAVRRAPALVVVVADLAAPSPLLPAAVAGLVDALALEDQVAVVDGRGRVVRAPGPPDAAVVRAALAEAAPRAAVGDPRALERGLALAVEARPAGGVGHVIYCADGSAGPAGRARRDAFVAVVARHAGVGVTTVGVGHRPYDDALLEDLTRRAGGRYRFAADAQAAGAALLDVAGQDLAVAARDVRVRVAFEPDAVTRYRLLGYEGRHAGAAPGQPPGATLGASAAVTALYEIKLAPGATHALATLEARFTPPDGGAVEVVSAAVPWSVVADAPSAPGRLALAAAGLAEKLRGAYWARALDYDLLVGLLDGLPAGWRSRADVVGLRAATERARALDRRGDRFAAEAPLSGMSFDHVPVVRR